MTGFELGDRVLINPGPRRTAARIVGEHMDGTHAELIAIPAEYVHPIPDGLSFEEAAAFPLVFVTAYRMLATRAGLQRGRMGARVGRRLGRRNGRAGRWRRRSARKVLATSTDDAKLERATELGADAVVTHRRRRGRDRRAS